MSQHGESGAGACSLSVHAGDEGGHTRTLDQLVEDRVASRLIASDATLWGPEAQEEAAKRLAWVDLPRTSRPLVDEVAALRADFVGRGLDRVVLCGMGGSSLAPEVICEAADRPLVVLDSSQPDFVRDVLDEDVERTVVVVSSKSGGTVETDSQRRAYEAAFRAAGIDPAERIVVVTDPGSPFDQAATELGYRVFRADPDVGGRYSALSAFGLVPCGLAGVDTVQLLDEAEALHTAISVDSPDNPALRLGAALGHAAVTGVDKLVLAASDTPFVGFGDWVEQLVAESTGKEGTGILPVVLKSLDAPNVSPSPSDALVATYGATDPGVTPSSGWSVHVDAPLGAQLLLWEAATAVAGRILAIDPFDQPDVESAKAAARSMLDGEHPSPQPRFAEGRIRVNTPGSWLPDDVRTLRGAIDHLTGMVDPDRGYLAVHAYLDRHRDAALARVRDVFATRLGRPVTFGWGPRFLHSTGQYHKGGPATGVYLQVTVGPEKDLEVPDRPFTFGEFIEAQAVGDASVLAERGRPVLRLHLDAHEDLPTLLEALE